VIQQVDIDEYNKQVEAEITHIRDFVILHYHVTNRRDTPFWQHCAEMELPASLRHRIELFAETGRVFRIPNELFTENSWVQVMLGQGITPRQRHPVADLMRDDELNHFLESIRRHVESTVGRLPRHIDYLRSYCGVAGGAAAG
jgi:tryptophan halogenase